MTQVLILLDAGVEGTPATSLMSGAIALQHAILQTQAECSIYRLTTDDEAFSVLSSSSDSLICPLTLNLPPALDFPARGLYQHCANLPLLREQAQTLGYATGEGMLWLPIVLTARGPLYGEAIALDVTVTGYHYRQPLHFSDRWRQPLYRLAHQLLQAIDATPATYLMQFGLVGEQVVFDRLFPFPAAPAIASLGVQTPDLFTCHWHCLMEHPILDLVIHDTSQYWVWTPGGAIALLDTLTSF